MIRTDCDSPRRMRSASTLAAMIAVAVLLSGCGDTSSAGVTTTTGRVESSARTFLQTQVDRASTGFASRPIRGAYYSVDSRAWEAFNSQQPSTSADHPDLPNTSLIVVTLEFTTPVVYDSARVPPGSDLPSGRFIATAYDAPGADAVGFWISDDPVDTTALGPPTATWHA